MQAEVIHSKTIHFGTMTNNTMEGIVRTPPRPDTRHHTSPQITGGTHTGRTGIADTHRGIDINNQEATTPASGITREVSSTTSVPVNDQAYPSA